ncbi:hypothetical protein BHM03_00045392 [Ensete ventricosum]|nr:hypothetical protein BHM03_00045392 [Ensete ventricosum]
MRRRRQQIRTYKMAVGERFGGWERNVAVATGSLPVWPWPSRLWSIRHSTANSLTGCGIALNSHAEREKIVHPVSAETSAAVGELDEGVVGRRVVTNRQL